MPTTRSGRPLTVQVEPTFRSNVVATAAVTAACRRRSGSWPETSRSIGLLNAPCGSWARRSTGRDRARHRHALVGDRLDRAELLPGGGQVRGDAVRPGIADVDPRVGRAEHALVGALHVDDEPEPDGGRRDGDGEQGQDEHLLAPFAAQQPPGPAADRAAGRRPAAVGRGRRPVGGGARVVLIAPGPRRAATPVPALGRSDRRSARRGGRSPGRPRRPAARRG